MLERPEVSFIIAYRQNGICFPMAEHVCHYTIPIWFSGGTNDIGRLDLYGNYLYKPLKIDILMNIQFIYLSTRNLPWAYF